MVATSVVQSRVYAVGDGHCCQWWAAVLLPKVPLALGSLSDVQCIKPLLLLLLEERSDAEFHFAFFHLKCEKKMGSSMDKGNRVSALFKREQLSKTDVCLRKVSI